jgi:hypothetical protein
MNDLDLRASDAVAGITDNSCDKNWQEFPESSVSV